MSDTAPFSDDLMIWLSAYVDGALNDEERGRVEELASEDPRVAAELEALFALNDDLCGAMDSLLDLPVPVIEGVTLVEPIAPVAPAANVNAAPAWRALAASLVLGALLGSGAMWSLRTDPLPRTVDVAAARSWLGEVAEYHQIYARQTRHLVEVPASEQAHIEKWLSKEIGVAFSVPDLGGAGWNFQGARLLVAAGKPVAQLMYTHADGRVIALCALQNGSGEAAPISDKAFGAVQMVTWKSTVGSFAFVGEDQSTLNALAVTTQPLL